MPENYFKVQTESQNFLDYFHAVNPTFLTKNVIGLHIVKAHDKVYLKTTFAKDEYLNKFSYTSNFINLDMVVSDCDCDENPDGKIFLTSFPNEQLIDNFVNLDEDCLIQIFDDELISLNFISEYYDLETV